MLVVIASFVWFVVLCMVCAKQADEYSPLMLKFEIGDYVLHIHHWLYYTVGLVLLLACMRHSDLREMLIGACVGGIAHGLSYPDWHRLWYKK